MRNQKGYTLTELFVTITIVGIMAAVAIPGMSMFIRDANESSDLNEFIGLFHAARSQAGRNNKDVFICPSVDSASCSGSSDWSKGVLVGYTKDGNVVPVKIMGSIAENSKINVPLDMFTFRPSGRLRLGHNDPFRYYVVYCTNAGIDQGRLAIVAQTGALQVIDESSPTTKQLRENHTLPDGTAASCG